jgi:hypothetical protein
MATTAFCNSAKVEHMQAGHCFNGVVTINGNTHSNFIIDGLASTAGIAVGMTVAGSGITGGTVVSRILSATSVQIDTAAGSTLTGTSLTFTADTFNILLIKVSPSRTYDGTQTNVGTPGSGTPSTSNVGTDETSGTGYTSGGQALTNVTPTLSSSTAVANFSPNPSFTGATFSTTAGIIYNTSTRLGAAATPLNGRTVSVHDFGGTQTVSSGTFTIVMPTADATHAILRIA